MRRRGYQAAAAQLDLAKAQHQQAQARLDELKINLGNTVITSPVNGFIGKRTLDPGAWVTPNSALLSVVDISLVRLVANVVEKDLRRISAGQRANVAVDAFPGEQFAGRVARIAPVLDPATRTAQIEVEIENAQFRLKPGMYARVDFTVERHDNTLVVPANALVDVQGKRGVFRPAEGDIAKFHPIEVGLTSEQLDRSGVGPRRRRPGRHDRRGGAARGRQDRPARRQASAPADAGRGGQRRRRWRGTRAPARQS